MPVPTKAQATLLPLRREGVKGAQRHSLPVNCQSHDISQCSCFPDSEKAPDCEQRTLVRRGERPLCLALVCSPALEGNDARSVSSFHAVPDWNLTQLKIE